MKIDRLMSWCASHGLQTPLQIRQQPGNSNYRYVTLDPNHPEARKRNTINLIDAPLDTICMTSTTSDGLADRLLFESTLGEDSFFAPYLATLPTLDSFQHTLPRFWGEEIWALLEHQDASSVVPGSTLNSNMMDGGQLKAAVDLDASERLILSCDEWAQAVVDSRSHFVPPNGQEYALTPVLDMINHNPNVPTTMKRMAGGSTSDGDESDKDASDRIVLQIPADAMRPDSKNDDGFLSQLSNFWNTNPQQQEQEVFTSYGNMPNAELLLNYGFVAADNPHNTETLAIPLIRQAKPLLIACQADGQLTTDTIQPLRYALMNQEEREVMLNNDNDDDKQASPNGNIISPRNEMEVMALVGGTLEEAVYDLKQYCQQLEQQRQLEQAFAATGETTTANNNKPNDAVFSLLTTYLQERRKTLQSCLSSIQNQYPDLFG